MSLHKINKTILYLKKNTWYGKCTYSLNVHALILVAVLLSVLIFNCIPVSGKKQYQNKVYFVK